ncbi:hypothetical protein BJX76DRAFT_362322 [Aspergillus varians]
MAEKTQKRKKYKPTYLNAIEGRELYNYMGNRVVESRSSNGKLVAVKHKPAGAYSLDKVWHSLTKAQKNIIKNQLNEQLHLFRTITQPYIGRINHQETFNFFDRLHFHFMGPFETEEEFDEFCLARVKSPTARSVWQHLLPKMRTKGSSKFVLTHGDLAARNIMVHGGQLLIHETSWLKLPRVS